METKLCKNDNTPLIVKQTQRKATQLLKPYYFSSYYRCPKCNRMYFDEKFKVVNKNYDLFTQKEDIGVEPVEIEIWTDGACVNNGKPTAKAAWGFVSGAHEANGLVDGKQTNNRAEGLAIYEALKWAGEKGYKKVRIHTDSQITIHGVMKHPEKVKENRDIFQRIHNILNEYSLLVEYVKVLGHSGDFNNERADKMANSLAMSSK